MNPSLVEAAAKDLGMSKFNLEDYEEKARTTNISVDEICVKGQNPKRPMSPEIKKRKLIYTSVINIENQNGTYNLIDKSIQSSLRLTTDFIEYNSMLNKDQLVFYTDGAREIYDDISKLFVYTKYKIILDWFHLEKKFKEFGSLAFRGKNTVMNFLIFSVQPFGVVMLMALSICWKK
jgi:hypothetical protein